MSALFLWLLHSLRNLFVLVTCVQLQSISRQLRQVPQARRVKRVMLEKWAILDFLGSLAYKGKSKCI
ncbi:hypothetical protein ILYODFUR_028904 [Ilyodon furcidens]|uniref:Secreted protein n=1 Tax=Ilyodon furcidens TaxID=33524 RepID=A0ABV0UW57_9TELE